MESKYKSLQELNKSSFTTIIINRIKRIIEKYEPVWRVFHEPIQNSIDAIQKRDDITEGKVQVIVNIFNQKVIIKDNGKGFPKEMSLLLPDGTDKEEQSDTMGYQGVGLKSVIYSSKNFTLKAKTKDDVWGVLIEDGSSYLESEGSIEGNISELTVTKDDIGTEIEIDFDNSLLTKSLNDIIDYVLNSESNFKWDLDLLRKSNFFLKKMNPIQSFIYLLEYYFKTQTYIGSINRLLESRLKPNQEGHAKKVSISFNFDFSGVSIDDFESDFLKEFMKELDEQKKSTISFELDNMFIDIKEVIEGISLADKRAIHYTIHEFDIPPGGRINNPTLMDNVYSKKLLPNYNADEDKIEERYKSYISLLDSGNPKLTDKLVKHYKNFFPRILGIYIFIGRISYYEYLIGNKYGIKFIAANGVPTQHELTARSSNQSFYFNPITFIINIDGKLNEGKTELINNSLKKTSIRFFRDSFENTLNRLAKEFVRRVPHRDKPQDTNFVQLDELGIDEIDIKRIPDDENTLIALFYQLLYHRCYDLPTYGLQGQGIFDAKVALKDGQIRSDNDLHNMEFKVKLSDLLNDFDSPNSPKEFHDCDLVVVWDDNLSTAYETDWVVVDINAISDGISGLSFPEYIGNFLKNRATNQYIPIIIVKDWVDEITKEEDEEEEI